MKPFNINSILRKNIIDLIPYTSARDEYSGNDAILMDANENPFNNPYNRYPDPLQREVKHRISQSMGIKPGMVFLGNGSDEAIDLLIRAFCEPGLDNVIITDPTYGMYEVCAKINAVKIQKVLLNNDFSLNPVKLMEAVNNQSKIVFLCSPNNPTSNLLEEYDVLKVVNNFNGIVVIDEAYIDFSGSKGYLRFLDRYPNLVILRTFSKAWGLAGIRLGMALASVEIIDILTKIKYPYNINILSQQLVMRHLDKPALKDKWVNSVLEERKSMADILGSMKLVNKVYPSDANFLLVKVKNAGMLYRYLKTNKLIVRDRSKVSLCDQCLRITIGKRSENKRLLSLLKTYEHTQTDHSSDNESTK